MAAEGIVAGNLHLDYGRAIGIRHLGEVIGKFCAPVDWTIGRQHRVGNGLNTVGAVFAHVGLGPLPVKIALLLIGARQRLLRRGQHCWIHWLCRAAGQEQQYRDVQPDAWRELDASPE